MGIRYQNLVGLMGRVFFSGYCDVVDISKNSDAVAAAAVAVTESLAAVADGTMVAVEQASPVPPPQSMSLETSDMGGKTSSDDKPVPLPGPHFVPEASKNVTALAGRVASLNCRIKNLDNWTVLV